jgi:hypothetical protein
LNETARRSGALIMPNVSSVECPRDFDEQLLSDALQATL